MLFFCLRGWYIHRSKLTSQGSIRTCWSRVFFCQRPGLRFISTRKCSIFQPSSCAVVGGYLLHFFRHCKTEIVFSIGFVAPRRFNLKPQHLIQFVDNLFFLQRVICSGSPPASFHHDPWRLILYESWPLKRSQKLLFHRYFEVLHRFKPFHWRVWWFLGLRVQPPPSVLGGGFLFVPPSWVEIFMGFQCPDQVGGSWLLTNPTVRSF